MQKYIFKTFVNDESVLKQRLIYPQAGNRMWTTFELFQILNESYCI